MVQHRRHIPLIRTASRQYQCDRSAIAVQSQYAHSPTARPVQNSRLRPERVESICPCVPYGRPGGSLRTPWAQRLASGA